jgi:hypothetical protein
MESPGGKTAAWIIRRSKHPKCSVLWRGSLRMFRFTRGFRVTVAYSGSEDKMSSGHVRFRNRAE